MPRKSYVLIHSRKAVLDFIITYKTNNDGNSPTMREISKGSGVKSTSNVDYILNQLEDGGFITRVSDSARSIIVTGGHWHYEEAHHA